MVWFDLYQSRNDLSLRSVIAEKSVRPGLKSVHGSAARGMAHWAIFLVLPGLPSQMKPRKADFQVLSRRLRKYCKKSESFYFERWKTIANAIFPLLKLQKWENVSWVDPKDDDDVHFHYHLCHAQHALLICAVTLADADNYLAAIFRSSSTMCRILQSLM